MLVVLVEGRGGGGAACACFAPPLFSVLEHVGRAGTTIGGCLLLKCEVCILSQASIFLRKQLIICFLDELPRRRGRVLVGMRALASMARNIKQRNPSQSPTLFAVVK